MHIIFLLLYALERTRDGESCSALKVLPQNLWKDLLITVMVDSKIVKFKRLTTECLKMMRAGNALILKALLPSDLSDAFLGRRCIGMRKFVSFLNIKTSHGFSNIPCS